MPDNMAPDLSIIDQLLQTLFPGNPDLLNFLQGYPYAKKQDLLDQLPGTNVPRDEFFGRAVVQIRAHNLDSAALFDSLNERFELQRPKINDARNRYFANRSVGAQPIGAAPRRRKALLRSLLPFEDGDELVGRDQELQSLMTIVQSDGFRFGVVWGRSGCGKTSLLRAGLLPTIRDAGHYPVYLERPIDEMTVDPSATVQSWTRHRDQDGSANRRIVVVIDQLEEYFLRYKDRADHQRLATLIDEALKTPEISFLLGIREDFFGKLHHLSLAAIPDPTRPKNCYELEELTPGVAEEILRESIEADETQFSSELIKEIVKDLTVEGSVRPVELQIVGSALKRRHIKQKNGYDTVGGARGLLQTYIKEEIDSCPDSQMAAIILRRLCAEGRPVKSPEDVSEDALFEAVSRAGLASTPDRTLLKRTLERLKETKLIVQRGENLYNLVHDFIAALVAVATAGIETIKEQANRLILKYVAEYRADKKFRIPRRHLRMIRAKADRSILDDPTTKTLYRWSVVSAAVEPMVPISIVALVFLAAYAAIIVSEYLSTEAAQFAKSTPSIVIRDGHPSLKCLPGFDEVRVDTGYFMLDVEDSAEAAEAFPHDKLVSLRLAGAGGYSRWAEDLIPKLSLPKQIPAWRLVGDSEQALEVARETLASGNTRIAYSVGLSEGTVNSTSGATILDKLLADFDAANKPVQQSAVATALGLITLDRDGNNFKDIFRPTFAGYVELANRKETKSNENFSWDLRQFERGPIALLLAEPSLASEQDTKVLLDFIGDPKSDAFRARIVLNLLEVIALTNRDRTSMIFQRMIDLISAHARFGEYGWDVTDKISLLGKIARAFPDQVSPEHLAPFATLAKADPKSAALEAYTLMVSSNRTAEVPTDTLEAIRTCAASLDTKQVEAAGACALALLRLSGMKSAEGIDAFSKASSSQDEVVSQTALYLALTDPSTARSDLDRPALLSRFTANECRGSRSDVRDNPNGYARFSTVLEATKDIVRPSHVDELIATFENCTWVNSKMDGVELMLSAAKYQPAAVLTLEERLNKLDAGGFDSKSDNADLHELVVAALARADYAQRKAAGPIPLSDIQSMLETHQSAKTRMFGSYGAYLLWLDKKTQRDAIERMLKALAERPDADVRMAANRAREMIWVARQTVAGTPAVPRGQALARLQMFEGQFETHIATAARLAGERVAEMEP